jgi:hypothetical protein
VTVLDDLSTGSLENVRDFMTTRASHSSWGRRPMTCRLPG